MVAFAENKFAIPAGSSRPGSLCDRRVLCGKKCHPQYSAETDNYYVRNRYYAPVLGRWPTRTPIGTRGGINLYGYVGGNPVGNVDGTGLKWTITRDGKTRAVVTGQKGDRIADSPTSLMATRDNHGNCILLDATEYRKWLKPANGASLPTSTVLVQPEMEYQPRCLRDCGLWVPILIGTFA
jgi:RHS repeat-associated protein